MAYRFLVKDVAPQRLAVARARADAFDWGATLSNLLASVWHALNQHESVTVGPAMARFRQADAQTVEIEAGFPVAEAIADCEAFAVGELPACRAVTTLHEGPYQRLSEAQTLLAEWAAGQSITVEGSPWLIFWATPDDVDVPAELRTELVWPIRE